MEQEFRDIPREVMHLSPGAVEVKDEPYVDYSDEDIDEMVKSTPPYDKLYGKTVGFNVSNPTSLEPNTNDSTGGVFNNNNFNSHPCMMRKI
jgi:hypothetical protein